MNITYLNNLRVEPKDRISLFNASFLYGINVFEGIRGYWSESKMDLKIFEIDEHLDRLYDSSNQIGFIAPINKQSLKDELINIIAKESISENVYIRITLFIDGDTSWSERENISRIISIRSMESNLLSILPLTLLISSYNRISNASMPPFVKAGANYLNSRYALLEAKSKGFDGALFVSHKGYISESTGSCVFFIKNRTVYTPSVDCDILVGITRNRIIHLCRLIDIEVIETKILPGDLSQFESAFLAGTMIEIKPINQINQLFFDSYNTVFNLICNKFKEYIYELEI